MTTGVLIFAYNNEHIDYLAMANWSAQNIRRHLNLPVAVVTDQLVPDSYKFEQTIYAKTTSEYQRKFEDIKESVTWFNGNRVDAYYLSPWKQTLVLDADYVVASNQLEEVLKLKQDFIAHKNAYDVTNTANFNELNNFGKFKMPMWWATVMMFRRSNHAEMIFNTMTMIKKNWEHYRHLHGVGRPTYRNDFALSMSLGIVNGHTINHPSIPWGLASVTHNHKLTQLEEDKYRVEYVTQDGKPRYVTINQDFHAMGKGHLGAIIAS